MICVGGVGRAFSPFDIGGWVSWAAGQGWYEFAPLALANGVGLEGLSLKKYLRCYFPAMVYGLFLRV